jgi:hypothetical protein
MVEPPRRGQTPTRDRTKKSSPLEEKILILEELATELPETTRQLLHGGDGKATATAAAPDANALSSPDTLRNWSIRLYCRDRKNWARRMTDNAFGDAATQRL